MQKKTQANVVQLGYPICGLDFQYMDVTSLKPLIPNNLERSMSSSYIEYNTTDMDVLGENLPYSNFHTNRKVGPQEIMKNTSNSIPSWKYVSICLILSWGIPS